MSGPAATTPVAPAAAAAAGASTEPVSSTRLAPRHVIYRNAALTRTAPDLGTGVRDSDLIREAQRIAEEVRDKFKSEKTSVEEIPTVTGDGETADAMRHKRRLQMNRRSAANSRLRRDAYVSALETQLMKIEMEYKRMEAELQALQTGQSEVTTTAQQEFSSDTPERLPDEVHNRRVELTVPEDVSPPTPPGAPPQLGSPVEIAYARSGDSPFTFPASASPSAVIAPQSVHVSGHLVHLATAMDRCPSPHNPTHSSTLCSKLEHLAVLPEEGRVAEAVVEDPARIELPEVIPDLAAFDPEFFENLMNDFELESEQLNPHSSQSEMLSFYQSLPE